MTLFDYAIIISVVVFYIIWNKHQRKKRRLENTMTLEKLIAKQQLKESASAVAKATDGEEEQQPAVEIPEAFFALKLLSATEEDPQAIENSQPIMGKPHPIFLSLARHITETKELFDIVRTDPDLVAKIIFVANSSMYNLEKPITKLNHAVLFLGFTQVKNIATRFALERNAVMKDQEQLKAYKKIWNACYLASAMGFHLAKEMDLDDPGELSTACLLYYLGDIAILSAYPQAAKVYVRPISTYQRVAILQKNLKTNSANMGFATSLSWNLPAPIPQHLRKSLTPLTNELDENMSESAYRQLIFCYCVCQIADMIVFENKPDIFRKSQVDIINASKAEFYYTEGLLEKAKLKRLKTMVNSLQFRNKANRLIGIAMQLEYE